MDIYQIMITHNRGWTSREILAFAIIFILMLFIVIRMLRRKVIRIYQAVPILLIVSFLAIVFGSTVFTRNPGARTYQLELFWSWKEIFKIGECGRVGSTGSKEMLKENMLNMVLLFPLGLLLPFARGKRLSWWKGIAIGCIVSACIEVLQLVLCRGLFEFDDIIHNSIGCLIGCLCGNYLMRKLLIRYSLRLY